MNLYVQVERVIFKYLDQEIIIKVDEQDKIINVISQFAKIINENVIDLYFISGENELSIEENLTCRGVAGNVEQFTLTAKKYKKENEEIKNSNFIKGNNQSISLIYKISKDDSKVKIFGQDFVKHNYKKCKIIYQNKEFELKEYLEINKNKNKDEKIEIKLVILSNLTNMSNMFYYCSNLISVPDISKIDTSFVYYMHSVFSHCSSLSQIDNNISKWNISNVEDISYLFYSCSSLKSLPDISGGIFQKFIICPFAFSDVKN